MPKLFSCVYLTTHYSMLHGNVENGLILTLQEEKLMEFDLSTSNKMVFWQSLIQLTSTD